VIEVDSRPSDAIALGVADGVPILVDESVLSEAASDAGVEPPPSAGGTGAPGGDEDDGEEDDA
jgi:bifunctional DNase/RNase